MASDQVGLRESFLRFGGSRGSSYTSPRGLRYACTSPQTTHCTRLTSSSYMLMIVWVVSALQRELGQYASISPPTSSTSSSKMESIPSTSCVVPLKAMNYTDLLRFGDSQGTIRMALLPV